MNRALEHLEERAPDDTVASATTICRPGSGDMCDPDESCPGEADMGCPADVIAPSTTICNPGSGDMCDPDESCPGTPGGTCPDDTVASATTICRPGSGDMCDPDESCPGEADMGCPADVIAPSTTICNPGSGDMCDPDESCPGTPGGTCPDDTVASATTICRPGSGDMCDPDESCPGEADMGCPADVITPSTTICNPGSGDMCDPDESCPGTPGGTCPDDTVASATTICRPGSGDMCDPDESCPGEADMGCPADVITPATTVCNPGSGDMCDPDESCPGVAGGACPDDVIASATTICRPGSGDSCDPDESCPGIADAGCPDDTVEPPGTPCEGDGSICTVDECPGEPGGTCQHIFDPTLDPVCAGVCRTAGFWGARGGSEKGGCNYTQAVLDAASGCVEVCGNTVCGNEDLPVGDIGSTGEGLCVPVNGAQENQLYRQVLTATLNCILTGAGLDQCATLVDAAVGAGTWDDCTSICSGVSDPATASGCIDRLDCWNNGLAWLGNGCALGTCSISGAPCEGSDFGPCPYGEYCQQINFCHDLSLCEAERTNSGLMSLMNTCEKFSCENGEKLGPASSSRLCHSQNRSDCSFADQSECTHICEACSE